MRALRNVVIKLMSKCSEIKVKKKDYGVKEIQVSETEFMNCILDSGKKRNCYS